MPSECPRQTVTAVVNRNRAIAPQLTQIGPPTIAVMVMAEIQSDFFGHHLTRPSTALVSGASNIRGERKVLAEFASASSTGSTADCGCGTLSRLIASPRALAPTITASN